MDVILWWMFPCESFKHIYAVHTDGGVIASESGTALFVAFVEKAPQGALWIHALLSLPGVTPRTLDAGWHQPVVGQLGSATWRALWRRYRRPTRPMLRIVVLLDSTLWVRSVVTPVAISSIRISVIEFSRSQNKKHMTP